MSDQPAALILGGAGFIGRHLIKYICDNRLVSYLRVVDKQLPATAYLATFEPYYAPREGFEFLQGDLSVPSHVERAFGGMPFHVVINLAGETQHGHGPERYEKCIAGLRSLCASHARVVGGVERYIEVSTTAVYAPTDSDATEDAPLQPQTAIAQGHLQAERAVAATDLPYIVARFPLVYGPGDRHGLMPCLACAAVYAGGTESLDFMWDADLPMHTLHAQDAAAALWHLVCAGEVGTTYNVADEGRTTQGDIANILSQLFHIRVKFLGNTVTRIASTVIAAAREDANDTHLTHWMSLLKHHGIRDSPITPYIEAEQLIRHPHVSTRRLQATGFRCSCPKVLPTTVQDTVDYWASQKCFPSNTPVSHTP